MLQNQLQNKFKIPLTIAFSIGFTLPTIATTPAIPLYQITVNSNQDIVQPDDRLTLREAIEITNGSLNYTQLSDLEKAQIKLSSSPIIQFNLPANQTVILLGRSLPDVVKRVTIDGTTQPGYDAKTPLFEQNERVRKPIVEITPATNIQILRGLTLTSDNITVRGLSLYGFTLPTDLPPALHPPIFSFLTPIRHPIFQAKTHLRKTPPSITRHLKIFTLNKTG